MTDPRGGEGTRQAPWSYCLAGLLLAAVAVACAASAQQSEPFGLKLDVLAKVQRTNGEVSTLELADGGVLRTGDAVQIRVRTETDAYVYVLAYGSSGAALVLHPFSGDHNEARIAGGEEKVIPGAGGFLPLDDRVGREGLFAVAAARPILDITRLLLRMEDHGADVAGVSQEIRRLYPGARQVAFRHIGLEPLAGLELAPRAASEPQPSATTLFGIDTDTEVEQTAASAAFEQILANLPDDTAPAELRLDYEEQGVLSAEGTRITGTASEEPEQVVIEPLFPIAAATDRPAESRPEKKKSKGLLEKLGGWLGLGKSKEPETDSETAQELEDAPSPDAQAYPLPEPPGETGAAAEPEPVPVQVAEEPLAAEEAQPPPALDLTIDASEPVSEVSTESVSEVSTESVSEVSTESVSEVSTEPVSEVSTESLSEVRTEPVSEASTESLSEASTESLSEASTESLSEASTESLSEASTESLSEASTESLSEASTESLSEVSTESLSEVSTEPLSEASTESLSEASTEPVSEASTESMVVSSTGDLEWKLDGVTVSSAHSSELLLAEDLPMDSPEHEERVVQEPIVDALTSERLKGVLSRWLSLASADSPPDDGAAAIDHADTLGLADAELAQPDTAAAEVDETAQVEPDDAVMEAAEEDVVAVASESVEADAAPGADDALQAIETHAVQPDAQIPAAAPAEPAVRIATDRESGAGEESGALLETTSAGEPGEDGKAGLLAVLAKWLKPAAGQPGADDAAIDVPPAAEVEPPGAPEENDEVAVGIEAGDSSAAVDATVPASLPPAVESDPSESEASSVADLAVDQSELDTSQLDAPAEAAPDEAAAGVDADASASESSARTQSDADALADLAAFLVDFEEPVIEEGAIQEQGDLGEDTAASSAGAFGIATTLPDPDESVERAKPVSLRDEQSESSENDAPAKKNLLSALSSLFSKSEDDDARDGDGARQAANISPAPAEALEVEDTTRVGSSDEPVETIAAVESSDGQSDLAQPPGPAEKSVGGAHVEGDEASADATGSDGLLGQLKALFGGSAAEGGSDSVEPASVEQEVLSGEEGLEESPKWDSFAAPGTAGADVDTAAQPDAIADVEAEADVMLVLEPEPEPDVVSNVEVGTELEPDVMLALETEPEPPVVSVVELAEPDPSASSEEAPADLQAQTEPATDSQDASDEGPGLVGSLLGWLKGATDAEPAEEASGREPSSAVLEVASSASAADAALEEPNPFAVPQLVAEPASPSADESPDDARAPGLLGTLGGLFKIGGEEPDVESTQATSTPVVSSAVAPAGDEQEAAFQRISDDEGERVLIVQGTAQVPPAAAPESEPEPASSGVLAAAGSRIKALLSGEPDPGAAHTPSSAAAEVRPEAPASAAEEVLAPESDIALTASAEAGSGGQTTAVPVVEPDQVVSTLALAEPGLTETPEQDLDDMVRAAVAPIASIDIISDDSVASAVALVVTPSSVGSAVVVDAAGYLLASWQVIDGYSRVTVLLKEAGGDGAARDRVFAARVVKVSRFADLALLELDQPPDDLHVVSLAANAELAKGAVVHTVGHPSHRAWTHTVGKVVRTKARSSWYSGTKILHRAAVIEAKLLDEPGLTGAALFNNDLELVGIGAQWVRRKGQITAVSVDTIREFLYVEQPAQAVASGGG